MFLFHSFPFCGPAIACSYAHVQQERVREAVVDTVAAAELPEPKLSLSI
jgi:hypothetical protein